MGSFRNLSLILMVAITSLCSSAYGGEQMEGLRTHTVYLPVYSHVYGGPGSHAINLTTTLMVRNTDPNKWITVLSIGYYDSHGKLVKEFLKQPVHLSALASAHVIVAERDQTGGAGPSFLVKWSAKSPVNPALVQGIMITTKSGLGLSCSTEGVEIENRSQ